MEQLASFAARYAEGINPGQLTILNEVGGDLDIEMLGSTPTEVAFVTDYLQKLWAVHGTKELISIENPTATAVQATFTP